MHAWRGSCVILTFKPKAETPTFKLLTSVRDLRLFTVIRSLLCCLSCPPRPTRLLNIHDCASKRQDAAAALPPWQGEGRRGETVCQNPPASFLPPQTRADLLSAQADLRGAYSQQQLWTDGTAGREGREREGERRQTPPCLWSMHISSGQSGTHPVTTPPLWGEILELRGGYRMRRWERLYISCKMELISWG